ncbi:1853_t:CDS:1 [Dentiscutata heterogama]|uniref:1853_t:CDS:1 n=1 Tax=Dentiscutata heterogama TaxID=1316150 RepID=A0ACA9N9Y2_9GLOM|nr:1853_t:CDS:1 [Dentiscutata heterogama]
MIVLFFNGFLIFLTSTEDTEKTFDTTTKWTKTDTHCFNITTPGQNTALDPNDRVYITWKMLKECYELVKESLENINNEQSNKFETSTPTLITTLTNKTFNEDEVMHFMFKSFTLVLYNNPKQVGLISIPKIKFDYSFVITNNTNSSPYLWVVPFIKPDSVKSMDLFFIRVSSLGIVSGMQDEFSGVVGPFGINPEAAKFPKTLFAPVPTETENIGDGGPTHFDETGNLHEPTPTEVVDRNGVKSNNANTIDNSATIAGFIGMLVIFIVCELG